MHGRQQKRSQGSGKKGHKANVRLTFPHNGYYLAKEDYLEACLEAKAQMRATWSTPNLEYPIQVLCHHHAHSGLLDGRVQGLNIRTLHLRMVSSTAEHMSRLERAL